MFLGTNLNTPILGRGYCKWCRCNDSLLNLELFHGKKCNKYPKWRLIIKKLKSRLQC